MFSKTVKLLPVNRNVQYFAVERCRRGTSSLYITGDKACESFATLKPHVDLDTRFQDLESLKKNVNLRGMKIDVGQLKSSWDNLQNIYMYRSKLEKDRSSLFAKSKSANGKTAEKLKVDVAKLNAEYKVLSKEMWDMERKAIIAGLALPNDLSAETPLDGKEKLVHTFGEKPDLKGGKSVSHLEVAEKLGLLEFYDSSYYFLKDDAAKFEMGITYFFMDNLKANGFAAMSNSDFGKSVVVEGVGLNPRDASSVFTLEMESGQVDTNARLHLVGGASLVSFCAYHAKSITVKKNLPLRYYTLGRHYSPVENKAMHGLFSTWQSSAVETFIASADRKTAMEEFQISLKNAISLYESLGYHFQVVYLPPTSLKPWESLRASIQMFSCSMNTYIEVGSLSMCDDYISHRLLMCCDRLPGKPYGFLHVVSGTLVSIPRLLGCILEYETDNFKVPSNVLKAIN